MEVVANRDIVSHLLTSCQANVTIKPSSKRTIVPGRLLRPKGGLYIANEIIFTELKAKSVSPEKLAHTLGLTEEALMQVLRFGLDEEEQLRLLWLIGTITEKS